MPSTKVGSLLESFSLQLVPNATRLTFIPSTKCPQREEFRLLNASIINSSQIDRALEGIINTGFYVILCVVTLSQLG
jgi:hypothetical protein